MMVKHIVSLLVFLSLWCSLYQDFAHALERATVFTYRAPESSNDLRYDYDINLLRLALESTVDTDGPYKLVPSPVMNYERAHAYLQSNAFPNLILKLSYDPVFETRNMDFVPFPVDLGIVGYRVCFAHPEITKALSQVDSFEKLRKFTHGQGVGWSDIDVLRYNGFEVDEVSSYEGLFHMVANRRFDLFCRGANELLNEMKMHQYIEYLSYDTSIAFFYPFPRFFYTNAANTNALDRIRRGLKRAYENGSLHKLWRKHYQESIDFVALENRRIFTLVNPLVKELQFDYQKYFYSPPLSK